MAEDKNLLVIGGTGFIGKTLVRAAVMGGYNTTVLSLRKPTPDKIIENAEYLVADIASIENLSDVMSGRKFSYVVNLGGYIDHSDYMNGGRGVMDAHFVGVQNLIQCLDWSILKAFVQIGSSDEYGDNPAPQREDMREKPISPYSMGKVATTHLLQMLNRVDGFPAIIVRLFLVYGEGQGDDRFLPQVINGCIKDASFPASYGEQLRDLCHVDDIVVGVISAMESSNAQGEVINLASGAPLKIRDVLEEIRRLVGGGDPKYGEIPYRPGENMELYADISKAQRILSWEPKIDLVDGLNRVVRYHIEKSGL